MSEFKVVKKAGRPALVNFDKVEAIEPPHPGKKEGCMLHLTSGGDVRVDSTFEELADLVLPPLVIQGGTDNFEDLEDYDGDD